MTIFCVFLRSLQIFEDLRTKTSYPRIYIFSKHDEQFRSGLRCIDRQRNVFSSQMEKNMVWNTSIPISLIAHLWQRPDLCGTYGSSVTCPLKRQRLIYARDEIMHRKIYQKSPHVIVQLMDRRLDFKALFLSSFPFHKGFLFYFRMLSQYQG